MFKQEKDQIELWDLHNKNIYIKVKKEIVSVLFNSFKKSKEKFEIKYIWEYTKNNCSIPLDLIIKILDSFPSQEKTKFKNLVELNIEEIKSGYGPSKPIKDPALPIKFSPELARICGHLIGDGGIEFRKNVLESITQTKILS